MVDERPGGGSHGGAVGSRGTPAGIAADPASLTVQYLSGAKEIPVPRVRRSGSGKKLTVVGVTGNNLKNVPADFPLGTLV